MKAISDSCFAVTVQSVRSEQLHKLNDMMISTQHRTQL